MKKKLLSILIPVVAGVGLVGATFAAWAVTDNANPLGIKISPTTISGDTTDYSTMVLSWGDTTNFVKVENLQKGVKTYRSIQVQSEVEHSGNDTAVGGNLSAYIEDRSTHLAGAPKLIENIVVKVYADKDNSGTPNEFDSGDTLLFTLDGTASTPVLTGAADVETDTEGDPKTIFFEIEVPSTVTAIAYNQMASDVIYLGIDWNKPSSVTAAHVQNIYFKKPAGYNGVPYAYAYEEGSDPINHNHTWPGVAMTQYNGSYYVISVDMDEYDHIIFSDNGANQTADLTIPAMGTLTPYYTGTGTSWTALPSDAEVETEYYLAGTFNNWATQDSSYKLTKVSATQYTYALNIPAHSSVEYKVVGTDGVWYSYSSTDAGAVNCDWNNNNGESAVTVNITFNPSGSTYVTQA